MPYDKSTFTLDRLIDEVVQRRDIAEGLVSARYQGREIYDEVIAQGEAVWEVALGEIKQYDAAEARVADLTERVGLQIGTRPMEAQTGFDAAPTWMQAVQAFGMLGVFIWSIVAAVRSSGSSIASLLTLKGWLWVAIGVVPLMIWNRIGAYIGNRRSRDQQNKLASWLQRKDQLTAESGIESLKPTIEAQGQKIQELLLENVRLLVTAAINRRLEPSYVTRFEIANPSGFSEVFDKRFTIRTPARVRLEFMLNNMPGGSIGIAGSRGAGKTTLLRLFCGPKRVIETLNGKPVLGVLVSAPVAYEARDFILYVFSTICQNVITIEGGKYVFPREIVDTPSDSAPAESVYLPLLRRLPRLLLQTGAAITVLSLLLTGILVDLESGATTSANLQTRPIATVSSTTPAQGQGSSAPKDTKAQQSATLSQSPNPTAAGKTPTTMSTPNANAPVGASPTNASVPQSSPAQPTKSPQTSIPKTRSAIANVSAPTPTAQKWIKLLKVDPAGPLKLGLLLMLVALMLAEVLRIDWWASLAAGLIKLVRAIATFPLAFNRWVQRRASGPSDSGKNSPQTQSPPPLSMGGSAGVSQPPESLLSQAEAWLRAIKFQQSYTSGWSGALKLPIGFEGGMSRAVTLAATQLSLPEIVHFLTQFLEDVARKYQVIVGIDEMDKLATDALAQQFLNDIKSIFGLEGCFYLVSVSENAMSNFERRGLPFRDAFDSSFDDFIYVDHLEFRAGQELLEQRLVGRPIPFFALSFCMSGGLARDLIRSFRYILEVFQAEPTENSLRSLCRKMVNTDLVAKVRAIRTSAQKLDVEPELTELVSHLYALENSLAEDAAMIQSALELLSFAARREDRPTAQAQEKEGDGRESKNGEDRAAGLAQLKDLADELGSYVQFSVTMRQFFDDGVPPEVFTTPRAGGSIDNLAKIRQILGVNPGTARTLLARFRAANALAAFV